MEYLFVTGMGRSGTTFLSRLLGLASNVAAHHEYIGDREYWLLSWYLNGACYSIPYLEQFREVIDNRFEKSKVDYFIDVNSYLQNSTAELKQVFDDAIVFHLVRDPRRVIPSIYVRRDDSNVHLIPKERRDVEWWLTASKFEQICWNWAHTTRRLLEQETTLLLFERIISDFDYLLDKLIKPCQLQVSREQWMRLKSSKVNKTRSRLYRYLYAKVKGKNFVKQKLPDYHKWTDQQRTIFEDICGEVMHKVGYWL